MLSRSYFVIRSVVLAGFETEVAERGDAYSASLVAANGLLAPLYVAT